MSPGIPEEAGSTARSLIDALKRDPFALSMILINFAMLGFLYFEGVSLDKERTHERELLYQNRREVAELLARCYPSEPQQSQKSRDELERMQKDLEDLKKKLAPSPP